MHLTPGALEVVTEASDSDIERVISDLDERKDKPPIVTDEVVSQILKSEETIPSTSPEPSFGEDSSSESLDSELKERRDRGALEIDPESPLEGQEMLGGRIRISKDITGKSTTEGKVEDFVQLFRDRYERLSSILRSREGFQNYTELRNVKRHEGDVVELIGLVNSKRETRKGDAWIIELEDLSGKAVIYVKKSERNEKVIDKIGQVVTDEVIGVKAKVPMNFRVGTETL